MNEMFKKVIADGASDIQILGGSEAATTPESEVGDFTL